MPAFFLQSTALEIRSFSDLRPQREVDSSVRTAPENRVYGERVCRFCDEGILGEVYFLSSTQSCMLMIFFAGFRGRLPLAVQIPIPIVVEGYISFSGFFFPFVALPLSVAMSSLLCPSLISFLYPCRQFGCAHDAGSV